MSARLLAFGTIPTKPFLAMVCERERWTETSVEELWRIMQHEKQYGNVERLGALLTRLGFSWVRDGGP